MNRKRRIIAVLILGVVFVYGYAVGRYNIFPYSLAHSVKSALTPEKSVVSKPRPSNPNYRAGLFESRFALFRASEAEPDVIMLGDSITFGGLWDEYFPPLVVINRGIGGDTTYGILERLDGVIERNPKYVFILVGINDIDQRYTDDEIAGNTLEIASRLKSAGIVPVVQSILYVSDRDRSQRSNEQITKINQITKAGCQELGIEYIDITGITEDGSFLKGDGIHITAPAYRNWSQIIGQRLEQADDL